MKGENFVTRKQAHSIGDDFMSNGVRTKFYADVMAFHPEVTGSLNLVVVKFPDGNTVKFIVDCGLFQERKYSEMNKVLPFDAKTLDFVLVTHNHIDHTGRLPFLIKNGYNRDIYISETTKPFIGLALKDSFKVLRHTAKRDNEKVLYSEDDVERTIEKIIGCDYNTTFKVHPNINVTFLSNGHLVGASMILVQISYPDCENINLLFTGDYNNKNMFFDVLPVPDWVKELPLTIIQESTYGNMDSDSIEYCYKENVINAINEKKTVITPVFSLGRAQEILYELKTLQQEGKLSKDILIFFDGKLAIKYTNIYLKEDLGIKEKMKDFLPENLQYVDKVSRPTILHNNDAKIVLTTSGMGTYGPAQVYIPEYISRSNALIHFTGYTAEGSLGAKLKNAEKGSIVDVAGLVVVKQADVEYTTEYSAHAKADEMLKFLSQFSNIRFILVNHGETEVKEEFAKRIRQNIKAKNVGILNKEYFFRIDPYGFVKPLPTKFK